MWIKSRSMPRPCPVWSMPIIFFFPVRPTVRNRLQTVIREHQLNRVIVASCSPRTHEGLFQNTLRRAGLNKYLFEMANIRDQCSWVHQNEPVAATEKAKDLVRMAVARSRLLEPLAEFSSEIVPQGPGYRRRGGRDDRRPQSGRSGF